MCLWARLDANAEKGTCQCDVLGGVEQRVTVKLQRAVKWCAFYPIRTRLIWPRRLTDAPAGVRSQSIDVTRDADAGRRHLKHLCGESIMDCMMSSCAHLQWRCSQLITGNITVATPHSLYEVQAETMPGIIEAIFLTNKAQGCCINIKQLLWLEKKPTWQEHGRWPCLLFA